jgi:hypothetical protein
MTVTFRRVESTLTPGKPAAPHPRRATTQLRGKSDTLSAQVASESEAAAAEGSQAHTTRAWSVLMLTIVRPQLVDFASARARPTVVSCCPGRDRPPGDGDARLQGGRTPENRRVLLTGRQGHEDVPREVVLPQWRALGVESVLQQQTRPDGRG